MPLEESHAQHKLWDFTSDNNPLEFSMQTRLGIFVVFVVVSLLCLGYDFAVVVEKEKQEQKNK